MSWRDVHDHIQGFPFLTDTFKPLAAASIVSGVRWARDGRRQSVRAYIRPHVAQAVYDGHRTSTAYPSHPLSPDRVAEIGNCTREIVVRFPEWSDLLRLPIDYRGSDGVVSFASPVFPQQILLGPLAFKSNDVLIDMLLHELSHVWFGIVHEIEPFQSDEPGPLWTLPSGTPNKDTFSVILAGAYAATVLAYLGRAERHTAYVQTRWLYLVRYLHGTCDLLRGVRNLTESGKAAADCIAAFASEISHGN
jgi:hypothetical protein